MPAAPTREGVTFTLDLEDHRPDGSDRDVRYPELTHRVLAFLDELGVRGTFFVVGEVAEARPDLVAEVASRGHEVGLHGWRHTALTELDPSELRSGLARGKALLEDLAAAPVFGFRAPMFSLVPRSRWALDVIADAGFTYSSSVLPARSPLFGDPLLPTTPFRWPNGLAELPCPVVRVGSLGVPYLGGVYLRMLPSRASAAARWSVGRRQLLWVYCHPYDFDPDEPFFVVPEAGAFGSRLLWYNRRRTFAKLRAVLHHRGAPPLRDRLSSLEPIPPLTP